jgi:hypothetical protein
MIRKPGVRAETWLVLAISATYATLILALWGIATAYADTGQPAPLALGAPGFVVPRPLIELAQPYIEDLGGVLFLALSGWLARHVRNAMLRTAIEAAVQRGAGGVYGALVSQGETVGDKGAVNALTASHTNDILATLPGALKALGVTPDAVHAMILKSLGGLLAIDPTATISPPSTSTSVSVTAPMSGDGGTMTESKNFGTVPGRPGPG